MDGDGVVEISLASPHLDSDGEALNDLVGTLTDDVDTHNSFFGALHDELEGGGLLVEVLDHAKVEGLEGSFIWAPASLNMVVGQKMRGSRTNFYSVSVLLSGLWLGHANSSHGRVTVEKHRENIGRTWGVEGLTHEKTTVAMFS